MRPATPLALALLLLTSLVGCGKADSDKSADPTKPLSGKAPSNSDQLVGVWFLSTPGDYVGMEFMKDGKALITPVVVSMVGGTNSGLLMTYSILDGGRLSLVHPAGAAYIYDIVLAGDQLELKGDMPLSRVQSQRFVRLPSGKTLQQAIKEKELAEAKEFQERGAALDTYLQQPGLVLVCEAPGPSPGLALDFTRTGAGAFSGKAWVDDAHPHQDSFSAQVVQHPSEYRTQLRIQFGPRLQPLGSSGPGGGQATLEVSGDGKSLRIAGKVPTGENGTPLDRVLKPDPGLHGEIVKRMEAELARLEALKQPLIAALKDYAVLGGRSIPQNANPNQPTECSDRISLQRGTQPGLWLGEGTSTNLRTGMVETLSPVTAAVVVVHDQASLRIQAPSRQYQLTLSDPATGKLSGGWFLPGASQGKGAELRIVEALDSKSRAEQVQEQRRILSTLSGPAPLVGIYNSRASGSSPYMPVLLTLNSAPNGSVSGTVRFLLIDTVMAVQAQPGESPSGPKLTLRLSESPKAPGNAMFVMQMRNQPWVLGVAENSDRGLRLSCSSPSTGTFELARADEAWIAQQKLQLSDALKAGMKFRAVHPERSDVPPTFLELKLDPATGKIAGSVQDGRQLGLTAKMTVTGEVKDQDGLILLATRISEPEVAGRFHPIYVTDMVALQRPEGWQVVSPIYPAHQPQARSAFDLVQVRN